MSISLRISLVFLLVAGLGFFLLVREEVEETKRRYREATEEPLIDFSVLLASQLSVAQDGKIVISDSFRNGIRRAANERFSAQVYEFTKEKIDLRIYVADDQGIVLFDSANGRDEGKDYSQWNDVRRTLNGHYGARSSQDDPDVPGSIIYVAAPIKHGGRIVGSLTVGKPNANANLFIKAAKESSLVFGLVTFLGVGALAIVLFTWITLPLRRLTVYAEEIRDGKRPAPPTLKSGEIRTLGTAFEEMREALEGRKYIERYVQALTHELKSPLTGIRSAAELLREDLPMEAREQFLGNIDRETARIQALVEKLLMLSTLQAKSAVPDPELLSLSELVTEVVDSLQGVATSKGISIRMEANSKQNIRGDRFWVNDAISNVVMNAIEFSPEKTTIEISISDVADEVVVQIRDHGPGIPDWALTKCFDQFYSLPRPETGRRSSGLGLTIAKEVAALHHGTVRIENHLSGGVLVEFSFKSA